VPRILRDAKRHYKIYTVDVVIDKVSIEPGTTEALYRGKAYKVVPGSGYFENPYFIRAY
jgi:hypothetical protein